MTGVPVTGAWTRSVRAPPEPGDLGGDTPPRHPGKPRRGGDQPGHGGGRQGDERGREQGAARPPTT